jgi:hypothetical protein
MAEFMKNRIKKERNDENRTTVEIDLGIMSNGTMVRIFEDMQEEIISLREENNKLTIGKLNIGNDPFGSL